MLVEQEGVGVDMMFAEMVRIGSRPPTITSLPEPAVRIDLYGQPMNENWYRLFTSLNPPQARDDVDAALLVWRARSRGRRFSPANPALRCCNARGKMPIRRCAGSPNTG